MRDYGPISIIEGRDAIPSKEARPRRGWAKEFASAASYEWKALDWAKHTNCRTGQGAQSALINAAKGIGVKLEIRVRGDLIHARIKTAKGAKP